MPKKIFDAIHFIPGSITDKEMMVTIKHNKTSNLTTTRDGQYSTKTINTTDMMQFKESINTQEPILILVNHMTS